MAGSMLDSRLPRLTNRMAGQYEFLNKLGEGGSGVVYEVSNLYLDRLEALKVLSDAFPEENASDRFTHEAKVAAALDHPNIVKIFNFGREDGIHWYSMQLVDGPSLSGLIEAGLPFDQSMLVRVAMPVLEALEFSHRNGVIHRDIKPANILFNGEGKPFIADFGVAKSEESVFQTRTGHMLGTPAYVAPEQALGESVDARADQYSLGITLYKTLTGRLPFTSDHALQTLVMRLKEDPEPITLYRHDLDPELAHVIMRSLARERSDRWPDIASMRAALLPICERLNLPWEQPLEQVSGYPLTRLPLDPRLSIASAQGNLTPGSFEPTADLPRLRPKSRRWWLLAAVLPVIAGGLLWSRGKQPTTEPVLPSPAIPSPAPSVAPAPAPPLAKPTAPASAKPVAVSEMPRRPVVYPQLLETSPVTASVPGCAGLRANATLTVAEDGSVKSCKILSALRPECAEAAKAAAMRYRFKPALDAQGKPVETTIAAAVDFPEPP